MAPARGRLSVTDRLDTEETIVEVVRNLGAVELADVALTLRALGSETYVMPWQDPASATSEARRLAAMERSDWRIRLETRSQVGFDGADYRFQATIEAFEDDKKIFDRSWDERVPRPRALSQYEQDCTKQQEEKKGY